MSIEQQIKNAKEAEANAKETSKTIDSFVNFAHNLGIGADNPMTTSSYGFNPVTRNKVLLEWIHRGSWIGGIAVDTVADDMTRAGVSIRGELSPDYIAAIEEEATVLDIWSQLNEAIKWGRLFGGSLAVMLIDGQDTESPLRLNTIRKDQFCGFLPLDRWMVEPSFNELVTDFGPNLGKPKYYRVTSNAPALIGQRIHFSRCIRFEGVTLPYTQRLMENFWGLSVLERLYDRMIAFDSATTGAAQLVFKSYLRTYKIKDLREVVAAGGEALAGLTAYVEMMRRFQGVEGITLLDADDEFTADSHGAFGGLSDALIQFSQQLSGALQIPLVRLFGQSPSGFSTGEADLRNYYDTIKQQQVRTLQVPVTKAYRAIAASLGIKVPDGFQIQFNNLWQDTDSEKGEVAGKTFDVVSRAEESGLVDKACALRELRQSSKITGIFTNITDEMIEEAENEPPPLPETVPGEEPQKEEVVPEVSNTPKTTDTKLRAAALVPFSKNQRVLLLLRAEGADYPEYWAGPGGKIEGNETPIGTAIRETSEETGFAIAPNMIDTLKGFVYDGVLVLPTKPLDFEFIPRLNDESEAGMWFDLADLPFPLHPVCYEALRTWGWV
jgi:phage-related protein (TIGR01555 family)